jgi:hypothetical protein
MVWSFTSFLASTDDFQNPKEALIQPGIKYSSSQVKLFFLSPVFPFASRIPNPVMDPGKLLAQLQKRVNTRQWICVIQF